MDNFEIGQQVRARFTNSHRVFEFTGKIVGKTKNYWKVEAVTSPYPQEQPGRVFHIATLESRTYSPNNKIVAIDRVWAQQNGCSGDMEVNGSEEMAFRVQANSWNRKIWLPEVS
jgi:hypothetical protein